MKLWRLFPLIMIPLCWQCGADSNDTTEDSTAVPTEEALLGTWEIIELEVDVPTAGGIDSSYSSLIEDADWQRQFGVYPGRTTYSADGKFVRRNRLVGEEESSITNGLWQVLDHDSIRIIEPNSVQYFLLSFNPDQDQFELTGQIDYDNDQNEDDDYRARFRLVGRTTEAED